MLYFDTSFLVPLVLPEPSSDAVTAFFRDLPAEQYAVSHWTSVEFSSLVARQVRMGDLTAQDASRADARFEAMVEESFASFLPSAEDFGLAKDYLRHFESGLRAGDALHLAIAAGRQPRMIYSLDKTLIKAGRLLNLPVGIGVE